MQDFLPFSSIQAWSHFEVMTFFSQIYLLSWSPGWRSDSKHPLISGRESELSRMARWTFLLENNFCFPCLFLSFCGWVRTPQCNLSHRTMLINTLFSFFLHKIQPNLTSCLVTLLFQMPFPRNVSYLLCPISFLFTVYLGICFATV